MNYIDISFYNLFCVTKTTTENRNNDVFLTHTYQGLYFKNMIICVVNGNLFFDHDGKCQTLHARKEILPVENIFYFCYVHIECSDKV